MRDSYLSVEQRRRYLVTIDPHSGKFRWAHPADIVVKALEEEHPVIDTASDPLPTLTHPRC